MTYLDTLSSVNLAVVQQLAQLHHHQLSNNLVAHIQRQHRHLGTVVFLRHDRLHLQQLPKPVHQHNKVLA